MYTPVFLKGPSDALDFWQATGGFFPGKVLAWQNLIQPYTKNWGLFVCFEFTPFDNSNPRTYPNPNFRNPYMSYGMQPRSQSVGLPYWSDCYYYYPQVAKWQGVAGEFPDDGWSPTSNTATNSMTTTETESPAQTLLVGEGTGPDWWMARTMSSFTGTCTFNYYINGSSTFFPPSGYPDANAVGGGLTVGPLARHDMKRRNYVSYIGDGGSSHQIYADGHAKYEEFNWFLRRQRLSDGTYIFASMWPYNRN
jgi:hypothetical protein